MKAGGNNPSGGKTWPPERVETLKRLWTQGLSGSAIAAVIGDGITRSSVIGAAHRYGCEGRPSPITRLNDEQRTARDAKVARRAFTAQLSFPSLKQGATPQSLFGAAKVDARRRAEAEPSLPRTDNRVSVPKVSGPLFDSEPIRLSTNVPAWDGNPVRFSKLERGQCAWIEGATIPGRADEAMACAAPTVLGRSWCPHHCDRAADKRGMQRVAEKMAESDARRVA